MIELENSGSNQVVSDGGDSFFALPPPPPPPPPPIDDSALGDFFALPYVDVEVDTTNDSDSPTPLRGQDSPFSIFADLVQGALGGGGAARSPQAPTLIPVSTGSGAGIGVGALLLVVALIGGAIWWFFIRKKRGGESAS